MELRQHQGPSETQFEAHRGARQQEPSAPPPSGRVSAGRPQRRARLATIAMLAVATMVAVAAPASAASVTNTGSPGTIPVFEKAMGDASLTYYSTRLYSGQIRANRSPASSGTQYITIKWRVWSLVSGSWELAAAPSVTYTVKPGQYALTPGWYHDSIGGIFSTDTKVTWKDGNGRVLGTRFLDYVHAGDYLCYSGQICYIDYVNGQYAISMS